MLNLSVVFFCVYNLWRIVILNCVNKSSVFSNHTKLNNMIRKLFPLKSFITIDINLSKKLNEILNKTHLIRRFRQMLEHYFDVLLESQAFTIVEFEILRYLFELSII